MTLLDITVKPGELLEVALWVLGFIGAVCLSFGALVKILHDQMLKRLEQLDIDLKPLVTEVAVHGEQIKEIKLELVEQDKWLRNHDSRIQVIEKTIRS